MYEDVLHIVGYNFVLWPGTAEVTSVKEKKKTAIFVLRKMSK